MSERTLRRAVALLALAGAGVAAYLTFTWTTGAAPVCATGGCDVVQSSAYADVLGVPVAALGLGAYLAVLATAFRRGLPAAAVGAGLALAGLVFSAYLLVVQLAVIDAVCLWCLGNDAVVALLAAASALRLRAAGALEAASVPA